MVGCDDAHGHDVFCRYDHGVRRHGHDRVEIACGQHVGEVAEVIGQKGVNQGKLRPQRGFEQKLLSVDLDLALAFSNQSADAGWRENASETATTGATTPEDQAKAFYEAWKKGDRAAAAALGQPAAVAAIFARPWSPADGSLRSARTSGAGSAARVSIRSRA